MDFDAEKVDGDFAGLWGGHANGIFFGRDEHGGTERGGFIDEVGDFRGRKTMMIGEMVAAENGGPEVFEGGIEAGGGGNASNRENVSRAERGERKGFAGESVAEKARDVVALHQSSLGIEGMNLLSEGGGIASANLGDANKAGAAEVAKRLSEDATGEDVAVAEGIAAIHEDEVHPVAEALVLEAVIEDESVAAKRSNGIAAAVHAVLIDKDHDPLEVVGKHERFIAAMLTI